MGNKCPATPAICCTARSTCSFSRRSSWGPKHGYAVAEWIHETTDGELEIVDAALYKALHRLEDAGAIDAEWGVSDSNRRAKYYSLIGSADEKRSATKLDVARYATAVGAILDRA